MTCNEVADFLMDYLDGALPARERAIFDEHVRVCPDCQRYIETYKKTVAMGRAAFEEPALAEAPQGLIESILRARGQRS